MTPEEFQKFFDEEGVKWEKVARQAGLKPE
jgi:hypothetical protein